MTTATLDTLYNSYDTTDLDISYLEAGHTANVDIWFHYGLVVDDPGFVSFGLASCQTNGSHICNHWHVIFDGDDLEWLTAPFQKQVACHEVGHTVGLKHSDVDSHGWALNDARFACMLGVGSTPYALVGAHNVGHIHNYYQ